MKNKHKVILVVMCIVAIVVNINIPKTTYNTQTSALPKNVSINDIEIVY